MERRTSQSISWSFCSIGAITMDVRSGWSTVEGATVTVIAVIAGT